MTIQSELRAALAGAIEGHAPLRSAINGVFFEPPGRASAPYALIGEIAARDWGTKTERGREARLFVTIVEDAARGARLAELIGATAAAIEGLARDIGGWRVASVVLVKSGVTVKGAERRATAEYRVRVLEE